MFGKKLLKDLFLPAIFTASSVLVACAGTATPTSPNPTTAGPAATSTAEFFAPTPSPDTNPSVTPVPKSDIPEQLPTQTATALPTATNAPDPTATSAATPAPTKTPAQEPSPTAAATLTPKPTPVPTATPETRITREEARKIKSEIGVSAQKSVFAIYLGWFGQSKWTDWSHWEWTGENPHDPRKFTGDNKRDTASADYPLIGPYRSEDPELMRYHARLAKSMGIDALVVDWYTYKDTKNTDLAYMDRNFSKMMDVAEQESYQLSVIMEPKIHFNGWIKHASREESVEAVKDDFRYVLKNYSKRKSFFKHDGLPVLFVYDTIRLTPSEWSSLVGDMENEGHHFVLVGDITDPDYLGSFSSLYEWPNYEGVTKEGASYHNRVLDNLNRTTEGRADVVTSAAVWPGFNDTGVWGWGGGPRVIGGDANFYNTTWDAALSNKSKWTVIATFNDWNEGTQIEPSLERGFEYLDITIRNISRLKAVGIDPAAAAGITQDYLSSR